MKDIKELSTREIQDILLDIYRIVDELCKRHNWKLFLTGGSVLGAVRHHGFIPWDDDMDLALPREEYEEFVAIADKELPNHLKLIWMKRPHHYRIADLRYEIELNEIYQAAINNGEKAFVSIDLQPFDGVPKCKTMKIIHCLMVMFYRMKYKMCDSKKIHIESWRSKWEICLIIMLKRVSFLFANEDKARESFDKVMRKYSYKNNEYIADFVGKYKFRDIYPKSWWEPGIMVDFEGMQARIPSKYDKYLSRIYGDYMKLPDEKERIVHRETSDRSN